MNQEIKDTLKEFFSSQIKLHRFGIILSRDYIGDIGKYLCTVRYDLELPKREPLTPRTQYEGYDGMIGTSRVQVKINNCPIGTPVSLSEPFDFDELIVVLGPNCKLRPDNLQDDFIFYRFTREEALEKFKLPSGKYVGGKSLFSQGHDKVLNLT